MVADTATLDLSIDSVAQGSFVDALYSQTEMMTVTAAHVIGNDIEFIGINFPKSDYQAYASFGGIEVKATVYNEQTVMANWDATGIAAAVDGVPSLYFVHSSDQYTHFATMLADVKITKDLSVSSSTTGLSCSFAGGCTYAIESSGLTATLQKDDSHIKVCGSECTLTDDSDGSFAVCSLPPLATTFSVDNYKISESHTLEGEVFPADSVLYDDDVSIDHVDDSASGCNFGITFKKGHVGVLDEAKVFINFITSTDPYVDKLHFEGSNDNWVTSEPLFTYG